MKSMTGFGRGVADFDMGTVSAEIKTVNSRFLEMHFRTEGLSPSLEEETGQWIKEYFKRGKVQVLLSFSPSAARERTRFGIDEAILESYISVLRGVKRKKGIKKGKISLSELMALPPIWLQENESRVSDAAIKPILEKAVKTALSEAEDMRRKEGTILTADLASRLSFLQEKMLFLQSGQETVMKEYEVRLRKKIERLCDDAHLALEEGRLLQEVALLADKTDYTEELTRFGSHLVQFEELLNRDKPVGRQMDFLLQEMNREVNTVASKSTSADTVDCVIIIKTELEKIREQVQNIE